MPQAAVVHVEHAAPHRPANVETELVTEIDVVVDERSEQVVRDADGVEVAREMEVDVLHRRDLRVAAAGAAAFDAETRAERRLAHADHGLLADGVQRVAEADGGRRLAFARGRRRNRGDENQLAVRPRLHSGDQRVGQLGLVVAIRLEVVGVDAEAFLGELHDFAELDAARYG